MKQLYVLCSRDCEQIGLYIIQGKKVFTVVYILEMC